MKLLEEIKSHSSKWIKKKDIELKNFYWQNGYGAFSVNPSQVNVICEYIENQKEHRIATTQGFALRSHMITPSIPVLRITNPGCLL